MAVTSRRVKKPLVVVSALTLAQVGGLLEESHVPDTHLSWPAVHAPALTSSRDTCPADPVQVDEAGVHVRSVAQRTSSVADQHGMTRGKNDWKEGRYKGGRLVQEREVSFIERKQRDT